MQCTPTLISSASGHLGCRKAWASPHLPNHTSQASVFSVVTRRGHSEAVRTFLPASVSCVQMFSGQLKARESEGPTHLSATSLCPDHSKQLLIPGSLALPTSFPLHLTSPASLLDPAHQPLPLHCSIMQISKPLNEHRNKMVKGRKSYNMALSFNFLISCPSWNKFAFPGPELNLPTFHLWKTYAKKAHWFGPLQLKAKMWAIWGNLDFSI